MIIFLNLRRNIYYGEKKISIKNSLAQAPWTISGSVANTEFAPHDQEVVDLNPPRISLSLSLINSSLNKFIEDVQHYWISIETRPGAQLKASQSYFEPK